MPRSLFKKITTDNHQNKADLTLVWVVVSMQQTNLNLIINSQIITTKNINSSNNSYNIHKLLLITQALPKVRVMFKVNVTVREQIINKTVNLHLKELL